jgi:circadian clock protein KaiC
MSTEDRVTIRKLSTGVPGLDVILGGGLPEYSFNIIAGSPGSGKTTLAHQMAFASGTPEKPALYLTLMGEPTLKMLRYQQQFRFFDPTKLNTAVRFINLSQVVLEKDLGAVLAEIVKEVEAANPGMVVVDSFRTVARKAAGGTGEAELQSFVQRLALHLTSWQATTFLIGEYTDGEVRTDPVFTVADGLFWLYQQVERNSCVRKLQVMKLRGQASVPGLHTFNITEAGLQTFPRTLGLSGRPLKTRNRRRHSFGVAELDAMLGGGIPEGDSLLIVGPSGTGKSVIATQFIAEGLRRGEPGVVATFEAHPEEYTEWAGSIGLDFDKPRDEGKLTILNLRPLDLSVDEAMREILDAVERTGSKRVVIDSLLGFEAVLAPGFRTDFRESLYRMIGALRRTGVTTVSTVEGIESFTDLSLSPYSVSFMNDGIIRLRFLEIDGRLRKILVVLKLRAGSHSKDIREYEITSEGLKVGDRLRGYSGLLTPVPEPLDPGSRESHQTHETPDHKE